MMRKVPLPLALWLVTVVAVAPGVGIALKDGPHDRLGWFLSLEIPLLATLAMFLWVGLVDSRSKWPSDKRWMSRIGRVLTFERSEAYQRQHGTWRG
jgi:hypothetical protein